MSDWVPVEGRSNRWRNTTTGALLAGWPGLALAELLNGEVHLHAHQPGARRLLPPTGSPLDGLDHMATIAASSVPVDEEDRWSLLELTALQFGRAQHPAPASEGVDTKHPISSATLGQPVRLSP